MAIKADLMEWVVEALRSMGGRGSLLEVTKLVWERHEADLRDSGDLFYTWQYDLRWAATKLRKAGRMTDEQGSRSKPWELTPLGKG